MIISNELYNVYSKYGRHILIGVTIVGLLTLGWFGYLWWSKRMEYKAQRDFAESGEDYYKVFSSTRTVAWPEIEQGITFRAQQHKSSVLYPYFLAYKADALIQQGKNQEALSILDQVLSKLNKSGDFYYLYAIKRALIKVDSSDAALKTEGIKDLENLEQDKNNPFADMASYYRGYYAWNSGDKVQARQVWSQIGKFSNNQSVWAQLAQVRLQGLS